LLAFCSKLKMGRRSTKTTKTGKFMNPTDQWSKLITAVLATSRIIFKMLEPNLVVLTVRILNVLLSNMFCILVCRERDEKEGAEEGWQIENSI